MSEIRNKVIDIIADRLSRDKATITEQSNVVADLGADSLDIAEIMMDLEDAFGVKLEEDNELKTIGDIIKYIESKVADRLPHRIAPDAELLARKVSGGRGSPAFRALDWI